MAQDLTLRANPRHLRRTVALAVLISGIVIAPVALAWLQPSGPAVLKGAAPARVPPLSEPGGEGAEAPGLLLTFATAGDDGPADARSARLLALNVPAGQPPSPFLPPGAFTATWTGDISLRIRGTYTFSAQGTGDVTVTVNDEPALAAAGDDLAAAGPGQAVKLKKGKNRLVVRYASPAEGDAVLRLYWSTKDFPPEPVPPTVFVFDASDATLRTHARVRRGRELVAAHRCFQCHVTDGATAASVATAGGMPELAMDAPNLAAAGGRLNAAWMAHWIADPKSIRADASMPAMFHGSDSTPPQEARDVAAYLATLGAAPDPAAPAIDAAAAGAGGRLFTGLGCVACHVPPDQEPAAPVAAAEDGEAAGAKSDPNRVPLRHVKAKYKPAALREFLLGPEKHYAWTRMPNFRLSEEEATQLTAFLLSRGPADALPAGDVAGDPDRGRAVFASSGCLNCHAGPPGVENASAAPGLDKLMASDWARGCVAPDAASRGAAPNFGFTDDDRAALAAFAAADWTNLTRDHLAEFAHRQYAALNCAACHQRDKQQDVWTSLKPEVEALETTLPPAPPEGEDTHQFAPDQSRPSLTWIGEKLKPEWAAKFIAGEVAEKPRPWLRSRMPGFPARARELAEGMAMEHGFATTSPPEPAPEAELVEVGRALAGRNGGFSCNQCHAIADVPAFAAFEAPAPNFAETSQRLRRHYYDRWTYNPQRVEPGTRMPQFADLDGRTALKDHFDGDARRQFDALWHYLLTGEEIDPAE